MDHTSSSESANTAKPNTSGQQSLPQRKVSIEDFLCISESNKSSTSTSTGGGTPSGQISKVPSKSVATEKAKTVDLERQKSRANESTKESGEVGTPKKEDIKKGKLEYFLGFFSYLCISSYIVEI